MSGRYLFALLMLAFSTQAAEPVHPSDSVVPPPDFRYTLPAATIGALSYKFNGSFYLGMDASLVTGVNGKPSVRSLQTNRAIEPGTAQLYTGAAGLRFGVHRLADIGIELPLYIDNTGWGQTLQTFGDLSVSLTMATDRQPSRLLAGGVRLSVTMPTGNAEDAFFPRNVYYVTEQLVASPFRGVTFAQDKWFFHPLLLGSLDLRNSQAGLPVEIHVNVGVDASDTRENLSANAALALAVRPVPLLALMFEVAGQCRPLVPGRSLPDALLSDPLRGVPSAEIDFPCGLSLTAAAEIGLSRSTTDSRLNWFRNDYAYATKAVPQLGGALMLSYRGSLFPILRRLGKSNAERKAWSASTLPGDRDADTIADSLDACPGTPEDRDGYQDSDGCPDYDNDTDGVADEIDACPEQPEDIDRFNDNDGCPDFDNDGDGIPDTLDACQNDNGSADNRGCPDNGELTFVRTILTSIAFEPGSSKIVSGNDVLNRICSDMQKNTTSTIEFQVHTDNRGSMENCRLLSQSRADVLKLYLVAKGIRPDRIKALGMGSEFPIADNTSESGRAKNQRVEVRRIE